ncbi:(R)-citramalate synthase CimA [uncultured archaeon]|nr:(R)-citramalate synthase CimA [uncultured archaeon]
MIAKKLDGLGVDIIEAGSAITSEGEREAIKKIAGEGLNAEICSYCRIRKEDIDCALACDVDSIHLVVPVSDLHIQQKLKKDRETVRELAVEMTEYAKSHGLIVELSGEDASRADMDYLKSVYNAGIEAGADRLCFCDTVGILVPERSYEIFSELTVDKRYYQLKGMRPERSYESFSELTGLAAPISVHCHNDFGMATANTVSALRAGAREAHVTINGIGERAGNTSLEEVVMVLYSLYKQKTKIDIKGLYTISRLVSRLSGIPVAPNKAIVGGNAFTHEAGIHVHGLLANTATYEPITPELVGRERRIVLGKHAGRTSVVLALKELGLSATENQIDDIVIRMKELGDKGKRVTDADLQTIAETVLGIYQESKVKLEELTVVAGNTVMPTASIRLKVNGSHVVEAGVGTGPVDAAINALKKALSGVADIHLDEYHVDAITGGTDALVEVWVKLSKEGRTITARGARTDIIMASVEAVLEGINRLIQQEQKKS